MKYTFGFLYYFLHRVQRRSQLGGELVGTIEVPKFQRVKVERKEGNRFAILGVAVVKAWCTARMDFHCAKGVHVHKRDDHQFDQDNGT